MFKKLAYKIVLHDLKRVPMFNGNHDKEYADEHFIYGIQTVIEFLENKVSKTY